MSLIAGMDNVVEYIKQLEQKNKALQDKVDNQKLIITNEVIIKEQLQIEKNYYKNNMINYLKKMKNLKIKL